MSSGGKVALESRQKLPQKVQDVVCDVAMAIQNSIQASPASENVNNTLKTMAATDTNNDAILENLQKMDELLGQLDEDYQEMTDKNVVVRDVKGGTGRLPWRILANSTFLSDKWSVAANLWHWEGSSRS